LDGYLATPAGEGPWPGVVIVPEAFGLNDDIRRIADRFAAEGYLTFAPALYSLRCVRRAMAEVVSARPGPISARIDACRVWLAGRDDCTGRTGVIGLCLGGGFALLAAPRGDFDVASVNYGSVPKDANAVLAGSCPIVASYGVRDRPLRAHAARLRTALDELQIPHDMKDYPDAGHSFLSQQKLPAPALTVLHRLGFGNEPDAAADAWQRIFAFFDTHLRQAPKQPPA
ncbi:MAG TPA: dienelactone hydrolase family protein, partial [Actinopolymorphaceae bacterium]|nr:dienelactone hydrolase family protein [Actinopolymorphaceae bacterium]